MIMCPKHAIKFLLHGIQQDINLQLSEIGSSFFSFASEQVRKGIF